MNGDHIVHTEGGKYINTGGGSYNEVVHGNSINIQGSSISIQNSSINVQEAQEFVNQIYQQLVYLQNQGNPPNVAQLKVATDLATEASQKPETKNRLQKLTEYLGKESLNGVIGEAAVIAVKTVLKLAGFPLP